MSETKPRGIAERISRALSAVWHYDPDGGLTPGAISVWGPADTADLTVAEPDGATWTVRAFKGLDDQDATPAGRQQPPAAPENTYTVWAEDGEYQAAGPTITAALLAWTAAHPGRAVAAITDDAMEPGLVLAGEGGETGAPQA